MPRPSAPKSRAKPSPAKPKLPPALAARVKAEVDRKHADLRTRALADLRQARRRIQHIHEDFYDLGLILTRLQDHATLEALGHHNFAECVEKELDLAPSVADELVKITAAFDRDTAIGLRQDRAAALIELARALPAHPAPVSLVATVVRLPGGRKLDTAKAATIALHAAAKEARAARPHPSPRGRTTTPEERAYAAALQAQARKRGLTEVTVTAVATQPGQASTLRLEHVAIGGVKKLAAALTAVKRVDHA